MIRVQLDARRVRPQWLLALMWAPTMVMAEPPTVTAGYTGEVFSVVDGGLDTGTVYTGLAWLTVEGGAGDWRWLANALAPHGSSLSGRYLGDLSVASNIDADSDPRLQEAWLERDFGPWSLRGGMLAADGEFWGSDYGALFINSAFGAPPGVSLNLPGPPIFPVAAAGLRLAYQTSDGGTWRMAATDGDSGDPLDDNRHGLDVSFGQGTLLVGEYEQVYDRGEDAVPDRWRVSVYRHGGDFADADGNAVDASWGVIAGFDRALAEGVGWFGRVNWSRRTTSIAPLTVETGLQFDAPHELPGAFGVAVEWVDLDRGQAAAAGIIAPDSEWVLEATWALPFGAWTVQPDVQYIGQPGGSRLADDAWVVGVRVAWEGGF